MSLSKSNELKLGTILSYAQTVASMVVSLVYTPVMLNILGKTEYGLYNIAASTVSYVTLLNMGFSSSYVRFFSRCKADKDENKLAQMNGLFMLVFLIIGILAFIGGLVLCASAELIFGTGLESDEYAIVRMIMLIVTVSTAYNLATSMFSSIIIAQEKFVFHKTVNLIKTILNPCLNWIMLLLGYRSVMMAIIMSSLTIIADTFYVVYCFAVLKIKVKMGKPDIRALKEISVFSSFIALTSFADQINWNVDKILLGRFRGAEYSAVYSVAAMINSLYQQISSAISNVFIPRVNRMVAEGSDSSQLTDIFIRTGRLQMMMLLPVLLGFVCLGRSFIGLWSPEYGEAYFIALILMISGTVPYIQNIGISIQTAMNKHKFRSFLYFAMAGLNFIVTIPLCKLYGGIGCAIGTALSLVVANGIIMNTYYSKFIGLSMRRFWKSMIDFVPTAIATLTIGVSIQFVIKSDTWIKLFVSIAIICVVYALMLYFTAMNSDEKRLVTSFLKK